MKWNSIKRRPPCTSAAHCLRVRPSRLWIATSPCPTISRMSCGCSNARSPRALRSCKGVRTASPPTAPGFCACYISARATPFAVLNRISRFRNRRKPRCPKTPASTRVLRPNMSTAAWCPRAKWTSTAAFP